MTTLQEFLQANNVSARVTYHIGGVACFHGAAPVGLWSLSDYKVSSVAGGSVWLNPVA